jgi:hypothetical protein
VRGEVFLLEEPGRVLPVTDDYEGCCAEDVSPWLFERYLAPVALDGGGEVFAWVYRYRASLSGARLLPSGDYGPADKAR